jgi:hypothetical protein
VAESAASTAAESTVEESTVAESTAAESSVPVSGGGDPLSTADVSGRELASVPPSVDDVPPELLLHA